MAATILCSISGMAAAMLAQAAASQTVPTIDTEDATLGSADVASNGRLHPQLSFDLRNGDFARGDFDDDRAGLGRVPVHAQLGLAVDLLRDAGGTATGWLVLRSSNGFHAPTAGEPKAPRSWYESNNLAAFVFTPAQGLRTAAIYTIKASPNGASATTHEASLSLAYDRDDAIGSLAPTFAMTVRPKGDHGLFTQLGVEPSVDLSPRPGGPTLGIPVAGGIGWGGFYGKGTGARRFVSGGAALEQPVCIGDTRWTARLEALAIVRDGRLARLSGPDGDTSKVVPLVTLSAMLAY